MIYFEVVEDIGDGYACSRKFRTYKEAKQYAEKNEGCMNGVDEVDTEGAGFFYTFDDEDDE